MDIRSAQSNLLKLKDVFEHLPLKKKLLGLVSVMSFLIAATGIIAFRDVQRAYGLFHSVAKTSYPLASAMVNALHSMEFSRALAIQYALEQKSEKLSFLKRQFEAEFQKAQEQVSHVREEISFSREVKELWSKIQESQKKFEEVSVLLMQAHEDQLKLAQTRYDQIDEANQLVEKMVENLSRLSELFTQQHEFQLWNIAAQVILLEQRYLYQAPLSTPLSLTPELSKEEENRLIQNKEKFRTYMKQFSLNQKKLVQAAHAKKTASQILEDTSRHYQKFTERVEGEDGVFLMSEDEISKLGTVGVQLEQLEDAYEKGAQASLRIQAMVSTQMQAASRTISHIRTSAYRTILGFTVLFALFGLFLGSLMTKNILWLEKKVEERNEALAHANVRLMKASEEKSEFLSNISHDFKTPLNSIMGFTQVVLSDDHGKLSLQQTKNLNSVLKSGKELLQMINLILDFAKMEAGRTEVAIEEFSFEALVDECLEATEALLIGKKVALLKEIQTHLPVLKTDRPKIKRILLNLLSNATRHTERGRIKVSASAEEAYLSFSVADTGAGIAPERLLTIFDEFNTHAQSMPSGTGLGLAISKRFVTLLGGHIQVESTKGKSTTFTVKIPFVYKKNIREEKLSEAA